MRTVLRPALAGLALLLVGFTWLAVRAHGNLVTMDVRNADLSKVISKIRWQTWEEIHVDTNLTAKVTVKVKKAPLADVLNIIAEQTSARWDVVYPLYTREESLRKLKQAVRGEVAARDHGWAALHVRSLFGGAGLFAMNARGADQLVTLLLEDKEIEVAALALSRFAQAQIVPEDGTEGTIYLQLNNAPMEKAVAELARQTERKWTSFYALQSRGAGFRPSPRDVATDGSARSGARSGERDGASLVELREATRKQFEAQLQTMTSEERQRVTELQRQGEELRQLSPEQRPQRLGEMLNHPEIQKQIQERLFTGIRNTTPEQRAERFRRFEEMRRRMEPQQPPRDR